MYAVVETGGKQYLVKTGDVIKVEKLEVEAGKKYTFDKILLTASDSGADVKIGTPYVSGATVQAEVVRQSKYPTVRVEKFKRKVRYHKVHGARQRFTELKIV